MDPKKIRFIIIMVVAVFFFFILPQFGRKVSRTGASNNTIEVLQQWTEENRQTPLEQASHQLQLNDITFIANMGKYHETGNFINTLIPTFTENGITVLAVSFLNWDDQEKIDLLINSSSFDEDLANQLIFNNMVLNGYQEYHDLLKASWAENQKHEGDLSLRVMGLNIKHNWSVLQTRDQVTQGEIIQKVYEQGVPDTFMAHIIESEILQKNQKAVIYTMKESSLPLPQSNAYVEKMISYGLPEDVYRAAWYIKKINSVKSGTILIHAPWEVDDSKYGVDYPLGGVLDEFMEKYDEGDRYFGFSTEDNPFGHLPVKGGTFNLDGEYTLSDFCDSYILLGPIDLYTPYRSIPGFINESNYDLAVENFPGPKEAMAKDPLEFNGYITGTAKNITQIIALFKR